MTSLLVSEAAQTQNERAASIEGTVISAVTGSPVSDVQVSLTSVDRTGFMEPSVQNARTDRDGRYAFRNLFACQYKLSFGQNGFVKQEYGESLNRAGSGAGVVLNLNRNQALNDLVMSLTPAGSVNGRITDDLRRPLEGIQVRLVRQAFNAEGEREFRTTGSALTNDRGDYRLYWVTPGRYYLVAEPGTGSQNPNRIGLNRYASSYYPGTAEISSAIAVEIGPGSEIAAVDWSLYPAPTIAISYRVRGIVTDSRTGRPPRNGSVFISQRTAGSSSSNGLNSDPTSGTFNLPVARPGTYWLSASTTEAAGGSARAGAMISLVVSDRDVEGIVLTMAPGVTINGRVRIEGNLATADVNRIRIGFGWKGAVYAWPPQDLQMVRSDGTFVMQDLPPGPYKVRAYGMPGEFFIKEARLGGSNILGENVQLSGSSPDTLDILLSSRSGKLTGVIVNAQRLPIAGIEAVLIPDQQRERIDLIRTATTDREGRFELQGIPPGNYKVFAWENAEPYAYFDPEVVRQSEQQARPVRIAESSSETIEFRSIP